MSHVALTWMAATALLNMTLEGRLTPAARPTAGLEACRIELTCRTKLTCRIELTALSHSADVVGTSSIHHA